MRVSKPGAVVDSVCLCIPDAGNTARGVKGGSGLGVDEPVELGVRQAEVEESKVVLLRCVLERGVLFML